MLAIPDVLDAAAVARVRAIVEAGAWADGNATSGPQAMLAKRNRQLPEDSAAAREAGALVLDALGRSALFIAAALPLKVWPPMFNCYEGGERFDTHVDNAIRLGRGGELKLRSDLSATLFLDEPDAYDGGGLVIEGDAPIKLPAGQMLLYPASTLHSVEPVMRGRRLACFFWVQSMVRDGAARAMLLELDRAIQSLAAERGQGHKEIVRLTGVYHNLLRRWAET